MYICVFIFQICTYIFICSFVHVCSFVHLFICTYIVVLMLVVSFARGCRQMVDPVWEHGEKRGNGWKCNYCHQQRNGGGATRLKEHLAQREGCEGLSFGPS